MTDEELQAIKARCEKATPGPWFYDNYSTVWTGGVYPGKRLCTMCGWESVFDANFLAHAREDIPKLLAEVVRLGAILEEVDPTAYPPRKGVRSKPWIE